MLRSDTIFGKRESNVPAPVPVPNSTSNVTPSSISSLNAGAASGNASSPVSAGVKPLSTSAATANAAAASTNSTSEMGSKLIVGPNIKLKGVEITDCDTLVVEGRVEATMDSRVIQIAENGSFKGSAEIDLAEIHGVFEGDLTVRQKLVIYATGKVTGKIRYGKIVIEEGGQLSGDVQSGMSSESTGLAAVPSKSVANGAPVAS